MFSNTSNKKQHLKTHHTEAKPYLGEHFRKEETPSANHHSNKYNCIMCGYASKRVAHVIKHMRDHHTKLQRVRFKVDWLVEGYRPGRRDQVVCNGGHKVVALSEIAHHSTECAECSVVTTLVDRVQ